MTVETEAREKSSSIDIVDIVEEKCLELKGIAGCLILMHDAQESGLDDCGAMMDASYYLGCQLRRMSDELETAVSDSYQARNGLPPQASEGAAS